MSDGMAADLDERAWPDKTHTGVRTTRAKHAAYSSSMTSLSLAAADSWAPIVSVRSTSGTGAAAHELPRTTTQGADRAPTSRLSPGLAAATPTTAGAAASVAASPGIADAAAAEASRCLRGDSAVSTSDGRLPALMRGKKAEMPLWENFRESDPAESGGCDIGCAAAPAPEPPPLSTMGRLAGGAAGKPPSAARFEPGDALPLPSPPLMPPPLLLSPLLFTVGVSPVCC
mmetsp:Transcript_18724/g.55819  ORF Transcript_18724/g.55819 Transcript_18724/m.55819 type:complete len:229 (-) Transcript_18724:75-761(-)